MCVNSGLHGQGRCGAANPKNGLVRGARIRLDEASGRPELSSSLCRGDTFKALRSLSAFGMRAPP